MRTGSYFFVIDAFIASIIVVAGIIAFSAGGTNSLSDRPVVYTAEDFLHVLESTVIRDYESDHVLAWKVNGTIDNTSRSVIEQLAYFNATGNRTFARELATDLIAEVPVHIQVQLLVAGDVYAERALVPSADAQIYFTSTRIILLRRPPWDAFPPVVVEARTWQ